jgi:hypothetical protein
MKQRQLEREKRGARARKQARIAGIPTFSGPSLFGTGIRIATIGVKTATNWPESPDKPTATGTPAKKRDLYGEREKKRG